MTRLWLTEDLLLGLSPWHTSRQDGPSWRPSRRASRRPVLTAVVTCTGSTGQWKGTNTCTASGRKTVFVYGKLTFLHSLSTSTSAPPNNCRHLRLSYDCCLRSYKYLCYVIYYPGRARRWTADRMMKVFFWGGGIYGRDSDQSAGNIWKYSDLRLQKRGSHVGLLGWDAWAAKAYGRKYCRGIVYTYILCKVTQRTRMHQFKWRFPGQLRGDDAHFCGLTRPRYKLVSSKDGDSLKLGR